MNNECQFGPFRHILVDFLMSSIMPLLSFTFTGFFVLLAFPRVTIIHTYDRNKPLP